MVQFQIFFNLVRVSTAAVSYKSTESISVYRPQQEFAKDYSQKHDKWKLDPGLGLKSSQL